MAKGSRRRWLVGGVVLLVIGGAIGGSVAMRLAKKDGDGGKGAPVTLEFAPADLTRVEARALARWLPVSGALQPVRQATVKAKVSGDVKQITVREGETVQAGQVLARIDTADLEAKLIERVGALESAKAQLAMAEKTRTSNQMLLKQNFISQNAFDNSESSYNVAQGSAKSAEAQVQIAKNALRDAVAVSPLTGLVGKRHVQPGEKVAFDSPLVTIVDLKDMELQAAVPAVDVPELSIGKPVELVIDGFGERRFKGRVERINPATEPGTRSILVYVGIPNTRRRAARRHVRDGAHRSRRERAGADAAGDGRAYRGRHLVRLAGRGRQAREARRGHGRARRRRRTRRDPHGAPERGAGAGRADGQPEGRRAGDRQGAGVRRPLPASAPTSGSTQVAG